MKPANCFSVEYILGTRDNKPKEEKIVSKGKISSKDEEIHTKVDVQAEEKQENTNEVEDTPMTTSDKGNFLFSLLHCFRSVINTCTYACCASVLRPVIFRSFSSLLKYAK